MSPSTERVQCRYSEGEVWKQVGAASDAVAEFDEDDGFGDFESDDFADLDAVEPKEPHISGMPTIPVHQVRILLCTA